MGKEIRALGGGGVKSQTKTDRQTVELGQPVRLNIICTQLALLEKWLQEKPGEWNPFKSKLASGIVRSIEKIYLQTGKLRLLLAEQAVLMNSLTQLSDTFLAETNTDWDIASDI